MHSKVFGSIIFAASSISLLTWGGIKANNSSEYNSKIKGYGKLREEFLKKPLNSGDICKQKEDCTDKNYKSYLPHPNENKDWKKLYKSLDSNSGRRITKELKNSKNFEDLKDYCYGEIEKNLYKNQEFNSTGSGNRGHESCVLSYYELQQ